VDASLAFVVAVEAELVAEVADVDALDAELLAAEADAAASEAFVVTVVTVTSSFALPAPPVPLNIAIQNPCTRIKKSKKGDHECSPPILLLYLATAITRPDSGLIVLTP
jgi:hypothetical protein